MKILTTGEYYGSMHSEECMNGILFSEYNYLTSRTDWHFHENPYFMYVLEGNLYDVNHKAKTSCPAGSFIIHNWQDPHFNIKESSKARGFHIEFNREWFGINNIDIEMWEGSKLLKNPKLHHILAKLYAEFKNTDAYSIVTCELLMAKLCQDIQEEKIYAIDKKPEWIPLLVEIIDQGNESLSLKYLSEQLQIHPGHLSRAIPQYFSVTLGEYIRQVKIRKAINYMLSSKKSLLDITFDCGFSDQSHFSRTFKRYMGMTPKAFLNKV